MVNEMMMHHGRLWTGTNIYGWLASEKYRGARAYWDGTKMWSRGGFEVTLPAAWREALPKDFALDGEIWLGRGPEGGAEEVAAAQAVRYGRFSAGMRYMVFDAPGVVAPWLERLQQAANLMQGPATVVAVERVKGLQHLEQLFAAVTGNGGEGLVLRDPAAPAAYEIGRTRTLLKVKVDPALAA